MRFIIFARCYPTLLTLVLSWRCGIRIDQVSRVVATSQIILTIYLILGVDLVLTFLMRGLCDFILNKRAFFLVNQWGILRFPIFGLRSNLRCARFKILSRIHTRIGLYCWLVYRVIVLISILRFLFRCIGLLIISSWNERTFCNMSQSSRGIIFTN